MSKITAIGVDGLVHQVVFYTREGNSGVATAACDAELKKPKVLDAMANVTCLDCIADLERQVGGHAVAAIGQKSDGAFIFQNSWGKKW